MKFFKLILDFYINTSIHVAVAVFSLVQITKLTLNSSTNSNLDCFIFFGTILGYNFLKYSEVFWKNIFTIKDNFGIILVSFMALLGMIFFFIQLKANAKIAFFEIAFLVLLYPFLRKYGFLKMIVVSFCVTLITVYIPCLSQKLPLFDYYILTIQRFFILISLLIPFEISDMKTDHKSLNTIPQKFGIERSKQLGYVFIIVFLLLAFFNFGMHHFLIDFVIAIIIAVFIYFSALEKDKYYTSFWVESVPILWWILLYLD